MSLLRKWRVALLAAFLILGLAASGYADGLVDTYRQAAQTYRAMAARVSGADQQCDMAFANYYDAVANNLLGQGPPPSQPTCTPSAGDSSSSGGAGGGITSGGGASSSIGGPGANSPAQQLMYQGIGLLQQIFADRAARKAEEEKRKQEAAQQENERLQRQALEQEREQEQRAIDAAKERERQLNDSACQLLVQSRALLGQTIDLAGDNACSRITNSILDDMAKYQPVRRGRSTSSSPAQEVVLDGSNIPSVIHFDSSDDDNASSDAATTPDESATSDEKTSPKSDSCNCDGSQPQSPLGQLMKDAVPDSADEGVGKSASERLLESTVEIDSENLPPELVRKLNTLLDAAVVKKKP
jgi:hypothetical protein